MKGANDWNQVSNYDYALPPERIAREPVEPRRAARLLVDLSERIVDSSVSELASWLRQGDVLVVNDSKVIPARLHLNRETGGKVEVLLLEALSNGHYEALIKPSSRIREGEVLYFDGTAVLTVYGTLTHGEGFSTREVELANEDLIYTIGEMPLPPYLSGVSVNPDRYQTVYANRPGSVAAPTAGLHLDSVVLDSLAEKGIPVERVELAVGLGTFQPVKADLLEKHEMHSERYRVEQAVWNRIQQARRVIAVGTTVVRTLETVALTRKLEGRSELFIKPGFQFTVIDAIMTNFHLPRSTLIALVAAAVGDRWRELYKHGLDNGYRFLSFGDAMLIPTNKVSGQ
jgi:S-adenosylmethionine:tRNA ribosyltransferase-isomerase